MKGERPTAILRNTQRKSINVAGGDIGPHVCLSIRQPNTWKDDIMDGSCSNIFWEKNTKQGKQENQSWRDPTSKPRRTKLRSVSPETVRHSHVRAPLISPSSTRQWRIARQVWAKPSVQGVFWLGCLHPMSRGMCMNPLAQRPPRGIQSAADAGMVCCSWCRPTACDMHTPERRSAR